MELVELLASEGLAEPAALAALRARAAREGRALVALLIDESVVPEDVLADTVARAVGTVVFDLAEATLDGEAVHLVPEAVARRHLAIAVAPDPAHGALRVAFADPLDRAATAAVRDATGLDVTALVGTVTGIRAALDREFGRRAITATLPRPELPPESTRRTDGAAPVRRASTAPAHRIAEEATLEQQHEALVLALIEAGVLTRAEYAAALRRLLGRKE